MSNGDERRRKGDLVETTYDVPPFGKQTLYGWVATAGPVSYVVAWANGIRNTIAQGYVEVRLADDQAQARQIMSKVAGVDHYVTPSEHRDGNVRAILRNIILKADVHPNDPQEVLERSLREIADLATEALDMLVRKRK